LATLAQAQTMETRCVLPNAGSRGHQWLLALPRRVSSANEER
jgi:hypothetical protein